MPAPLGPMRPKTSPSLTVNDIPLTAVMPPKLLTRPFTSMAYIVIPPIDRVSGLIEFETRMINLSLARLDYYAIQSPVRAGHFYGLVRPRKWCPDIFMIGSRPGLPSGICMSTDQERKILRAGRKTGDLDFFLRYSYLAFEVFLGRPSFREVKKSWCSSSCSRISSKILRVVGSPSFSATSMISL